MLTKERLEEIKARAQDIPALIAEVERLQAELTEAQNRIIKAVEYLRADGPDKQRAGHAYSTLMIYVDYKMGMGDKYANKENEAQWTTS